jgi:hypothetical protein
MKRSVMMGLVAALLVVLSATWSRGSHISASQRVYFYYANAPYWAMIYDYTLGYRESATSGFITQGGYLTYTLGYWSVQVAYIYDAAYGRYTEALALRDVRL